MFQWTGQAKLEVCGKSIDLTSGMISLSLSGCARRPIAHCSERWFRLTQHDLWAPWGVVHLPLTSTPTIAATGGANEERPCCSGMLRHRDRRGLRFDQQVGNPA